jgi:hypothetical protein
MSKILKNTTASAILITDTGVLLAASPATYTIPATDYLLWAASSDIVTNVGSGDVIVNDGSSDLSISDGIDLIKGIFPRKILGATDNTPIGNISDQLKVIDQDAIAALGIIAAALGTGVGDSRQYGVLAPPLKTKTEFPTSTYYSTYTVPAGKKFRLKSMIGTFNFQCSITFYLERQIGGAGSWIEVQRIEMSQGVGSDPTIPLFFGNGTEVAQAGDKLRLTAEAAISKGIATCSYSGDLI